MKKVEDGGSAFPGVVMECDDSEENKLYLIGDARGMSLRDYFAGWALAGMFASEVGRRGVWGITPEEFKMNAQKAYACADAMIEARKGKEE